MTATSLHVCTDLPLMKRVHDDLRYFEIVFLPNSKTSKSAKIKWNREIWKDAIARTTDGRLTEAELTRAQSAQVPAEFCGEVVAYKSIPRAFVDLESRIYAEFGLTKLTQMVEEAFKPLPTRQGNLKAVVIKACRELTHRAILESSSLLKSLKQGSPWEEKLLMWANQRVNTDTVFLDLDGLRNAGKDWEEYRKSVLEIVKVAQSTSVEEILTARKARAEAIWANYCMGTLLSPAQKAICKKLQIAREQKAEAERKREAQIEEYQAEQGRRNEPMGPELVRQQHQSAPLSQHEIKELVPLPESIQVLMDRLLHREEDVGRSYERESQFHKILKSHVRTELRGRINLGRPEAAEISSNRKKRHDAFVESFLQMLQREVWTIVKNAYGWSSDIEPDDLSYAPRVFHSNLQNNAKVAVDAVLMSGQIPEKGERDSSGASSKHPATVSFSSEVKLLDGAAPVSGPGSQEFHDFLSDLQAAVPLPPDRDMFVLMSIIGCLNLEMPSPISLSIAEIAEQLGESVEEVQQRLDSAYKRLTILMPDRSFPKKRR